MSGNFSVTGSCLTWLHIGFPETLLTLFFYDKIFLSAENPETVRFYSPYQQDHDINYTTVQEIKTSTARGQ